MLSEPKANSSRAAFDSYSYSINPKLWYQYQNHKNILFYYHYHLYIWYYLSYKNKLS